MDPWGWREWKDLNDTGCTEKAIIELSARYDIQALNFQSNESDMETHVREDSLVWLLTKGWNPEGNVSFWLSITTTGQIHWTCCRVVEMTPPYASLVPCSTGSIHHEEWWPVLKLQHFIRVFLVRRTALVDGWGYNSYGIFCGYRKALLMKATESTHPLANLAVPHS